MLTVIPRVTTVKINTEKLMEERKMVHWEKKLNTKESTNWGTEETKNIRLTKTKSKMAEGPPYQQSL